MREYAILDCDVGFNGKDAEWIADNLENSMPVIYRARKNCFPDGMEYDAIIISGSSASANDPDDWIKNLEDHIAGWYEQEIPMLGVCFGHQVMAKALGGEVRKMQQPEIGWYHISVDQNPLFYGMMNPFKSFQVHGDEVTKYPGNSRIIAENSVEQAFQMADKPVYGVQFHPEMDWRTAQYVLEERKDTVERLSGKPIEDINDIGMITAKHANRIFPNFEMVVERWYR
ncbi:MAG: type 1 glutamine amidotransferase [Nanobdellota archaeon]